MRRKKILLIEDCADSSCSMAPILNKKYNILIAGTSHDVVRLMREQGKSIVMAVMNLDWKPEQMHKLFLKVMSEFKPMHKPVLVGMDSEDDAEYIWYDRRGAADFIRRPYNSIILEKRVSNLIHYSNTKDASQVLKFDPLTGLYMREYFYSLVEKRLQRNHDKPYDMVCADVEKFSLINAQHGVENGNKLLCYIADSFRKKFGNRALCARITADNFAFFVERDEELIKELTNGWVDKIEAESPVPHTFLRFGVYENVPRNLPPFVLYDRARLALRKSLHNRYAYVSFYDSDLSSSAIKEKNLLDAMEAAIREEQFEVYLQPKIDLATGRVRAAEALVRWHHPHMGLLSPAEFIPLFERNGSIYRLDMYMVERTCRILKEWKQSGKMVVPISTNFSRRDFENDDFVETLCRIVDDHGIERSLLHLEVTESAYTDMPELLLQKVFELYNAGFIIELDDFGSGYSSLSALSRLPIHVLKLDRQMITQSTLRKNYTVLRFILCLASSMGLETLAEGVETEEMCLFLKSLGCNMVQGYYFSKPLTLSAFEKYQLARYDLCDQEGECFMRTDDELVVKRSLFEEMKSNFSTQSEILRMINNNIRGGIITSNEDTERSIHYVSESLPGFLGYTMDELMNVSGGSLLKLIYHEDLALYQQKLNEDFAEGRRYSVKYRMVKKNGDLAWVLDSGQRYLADNDSFRINSIIVDIDDMQNRIECEDTIIKFIHAISINGGHDNTVLEMLALVGDFYGAGRCYTYQADYEEECYKGTLEWCALGVSSKFAEIPGVSFDYVNSQRESFDQNDIYHIFINCGGEVIAKSREELPENAEYREVFSAPLIKNGELLGFIGIDNPTKNMQNIKLINTVTLYIANYMSQTEIK